jgi:flagellar basal-body rod modification protein FlgD
MNSIGEVNPFDQLGVSRSDESVSGGRLLQEDFLDLMITQLRNQDPFKPMESGDFLSQLAQFGTVSGIDELESAFEGLANSLTSNQALQAANLVGRKVLLSTNVAPLTEDVSLQGAVDLPVSADQVTVGVYESSGRLVKQLNLGPNPSGIVEFSWDRMGDDGKPAPHGLYELRAEMTSGGQIQALDPMVYGRVKSVSLGRSGEPLTLEIPGLGNVDLSKVLQIS